MNGLRHDHIFGDGKSGLLTYGFQLLFEGFTRMFAAEEWLSAITTKREEVKLPGMVVADETFRHRGEFTLTHSVWMRSLSRLEVRAFVVPTLRKQREGWGTPLCLMYWK